MNPRPPGSDGDTDADADAIRQAQRQVADAQARMYLAALREDLCEQRTAHATLRRARHKLELARQLLQS